MDKKFLTLVVIAAIVAGSIATGTIAFADDDELSELVCEAGKAMTGILFNDDEITALICNHALRSPA